MSKRRSSSIPAGFLLLLAVFAWLSVQPDLAADEAILTKAFTIKFKRVDEVAAVINGLISEKGAITIQPKLKTIVVQDTDSNLRKVESLIAQFDVPPPAAEISVKLVRAARVTHDAPISEEIRGMANVGDVLKFNSYSLLDSGLIQCQEGEPSVLTLAKDYQLSFNADIIQQAGNIIRLKDFQLKKRKKEAGKETFTPLITVTVNLRDSETLVLGASRFEDSNEALLVILLGKVKK